jgi:hypothetical protein
MQSPRMVVLTLQLALKPLKGLEQTGLTLHNYSLALLHCISSKSPHDADAAGPETTLQEPLLQWRKKWTSH